MSKYQFLNLPQKQCQKCNAFLPVTEFYEASQGMINLRPKTYFDGYDNYCKKCRVENSYYYKKHQKLKKAIQFWKTISDKPANVKMADKYSPLFGDWANSLQGLEEPPNAIYCNFAAIDKRQWNLYGHAFNLLYGYKLANITRPKNIRQVMDQIQQINLVKYNKYPPLPQSIPYLNSIEYHFKMAKRLCKVFYREKRCSKCRKLKQTYRHPEDPQSDNPIDDEYYFKLIEKACKKSITLYSFNFKACYLSASRTGWMTKCKDCCGEIVQKPLLKHGYNMSKTSIDTLDDDYSALGLR